MDYTSDKNGRGYMAVYHDIEEICYGPESGMPEIARVFLCIRHKLLRDGLGQKDIGSYFISQKTGMEKRNIIPCIKKLEKLGFIVISQNKEEIRPGIYRYYENTYSLSPKKFGELYNWYQNNPTVRVYENDGKSGSYSRRGVVSDQTPGVVSDQTPGVVSDQTPGTDLKLSELLRKLVPNNPLKQPNLKNPSKTGESFTLSEEEIVVKNREKFRRQKAEMKL